ncbi:MAG: methyltransferase domain-containing protein, partial [Giesbergeria sp.]
MTIEAIDFGRLYRDHLATTLRTRKTASAWDSRAVGMASKALHSCYANEFVARMNLQGATSLLDVGCGPGTIGLAVANQLQRVVGLDYSSAMLEAMRDKAAEMHLTNVETLHRAWEDDWSDVPECDIVVASRSTTVEDIATALELLHAKAHLRVYLTHLVGGHFTDPAIQAVIGRRVPSVPDYIYLLNILHRMGIHPRLDYIAHENRLADAVDFDDFARRVAWSVGDLETDELERLRTWYERATPQERMGTPMRWA